jgi:hypothetical protein
MVAIGTPALVMPPPRLPRSELGTGLPTFPPLASSPRFASISRPSDETFDSL